MGLFEDRQKNHIPVWFMRQAGRYHGHYRNIKKTSDFMIMCKNSDLATEITMGPIDDFNFDAAILFSDLLFPLEHLNLGLSYKSGPPTLEKNISKDFDFNSLVNLEDSKSFYHFQKEALLKLKKRLPTDKTLLGFVGAPFTLYTYATEGAHAGGLFKSKVGLYDGTFAKFMEPLKKILLQNMLVQAEGNPDAICLFDTAVGELSLTDFKRFIVPEIRSITKDFKSHFPNMKIIYYSKLTHIEYIEALDDKNIDVLGIDWRMDLKKMLKTFGDRYYIQGNIDPAWLHLNPADLKKNLIDLWSDISSTKDINLSKWIFGLGHGVHKNTPEENVRQAVEIIHTYYKL